MTQALSVYVHILEYVCVCVCVHAREGRREGERERESERDKVCVCVYVRCLSFRHCDPCKGCSRGPILGTQSDRGF